MAVKIVCEPLNDAGKTLTEIFPSDRHPTHIGLTVSHGQTIFKGKDVVFGIPSDTYRWTIQPVSQQDVLEASGTGRRVGHAAVDRSEAEFVSSLCEMFATDMAPAAETNSEMSDSARSEAIAVARRIEMAERLKRTFDRITERLPKGEVDTSREDEA